jgi:peptidoglycan/xylan/chitin deacetylase (PgdA/CDA1 family)
MENKLSLIKHLFYRLGGVASRVIPLSWLGWLSGMNYILPFYHAVADSTPPYLRQLYPVRSLKLFENDILFFKKHFQPVSPEKLHNFCKDKGPFSRPVFMISFDDGFTSFKDQASPVLQKHGLSAICFINSDFTDNHHIFYRCQVSYLIGQLNSVRASEPHNKSIIKDISTAAKIQYHNHHKLKSIATRYNIRLEEYFSREKPYLSSDDIKYLSDQGYYIGAHSKDHPLYKNLSIADQVEQTLHSLRFVKKLTGQKLNLFSFPFTDDGVSKAFFEQMKNEIDLSFGTAGIKKDSMPHHLQRIPMEVGNYSAAAIVYGEYLYFILKSLVGKSTIKR